jgi:glycerol-3-phosphate acyltransferase PlsY
MNAALLLFDTPTLQVDATVVWPLLLTFVVAFLLGSIPCGLIISKVFYKTDIRESGSGNIGTTNAMRTLGKVGGATVFLLDFGKGLLSGFIALWVSSLVLSDATQSFTTTAFLGCVLGHIYSPWLKFKGGKGIAVAIGCAFIAYGWWPSWLLLGIFTVLVLTTRYVSVGSIAAAFSCPLVALWVFAGNWYAIALSAVVAIFIIWAHRENIKRLLSHTESRIGKKK